MKALGYYKAQNVNDAYQKLMQDDKNVLLGGGLWLKRSPRDVNTLIDLKDCALNQIEEKNDEFVIGSMVTLRQLETSNLGQNYCDGVIGDALNQIMGVPLRNSATIGGSVCGKFPFSDIITPLLALDATLNFYPNRTISLEEFLKEKKINREILISINIKKKDCKAVFKKVKLTELGFAILNLCVSKIDNKFRIAIGARPSVAALAYEAMDILNNSEINDETIESAALKASEELMYLDANGNSKDYRKHLAKVYVRRMVKEIK